MGYVELSGYLKIISLDVGKPDANLKITLLPREDFSRFKYFRADDPLPISYHCICIPTAGTLRWIY
jgi:hypothetical protein